MNDFYSINRYALIARPTREMIDWVNSIFPEEPTIYDEKEVHDTYDVFLIPEFADAEDALEWLKENFEPFLRYALEDWCTDESAWPAPLDWELFENFLEFSIQSMVVDTVEDDYDDYEDIMDGFEEN
jgi:hypothetical protein